MPASLPALTQYYQLHFDVVATSSPTNRTISVNISLAGSYLEDGREFGHPNTDDSTCHYRLFTLADAVADAILSLHDDYTSVTTSTIDAVAIQPAPRDNQSFGRNMDECSY